ncbi:MAG: hypothetical protein AAF542_24565 [Pseudomonadota bacterium]
MKRTTKYLGITLVVYVGVVILFESLIGYFQPQNQATLALTVFESNNQPHVRVLSRIEHQDSLYVAVNHWPRAWFHALQENPSVRVAFADQDFAATARVVNDPSEITSIETDRPLTWWFKLLTGYPPRYFVRLERV